MDDFAVSRINHGVKSSTMNVLWVVVIIIIIIFLVISMKSLFENMLKNPDYSSRLCSNLIGKGKPPEEIDPSNLDLKEIIGSGEFGIVYKGLLHHVRPVAIKTCKNRFAQDKVFLDEILVMGQFDNRNVIKLEGCVTKSKPFMIVTEYMENGSLKDCLRSGFNWFLPEAFQLLIKILRDIANGLLHLEEKGYVHRDVAARNILVNNEFTCKVSDFGLCRRLENFDDNGTPIHVEKGGFPVRWTAPEAITDGIYSSSSDMWSFGVLVCEVLMNGETPYGSMTNDEVVHFILSGNRLQRPMSCPAYPYNMALRCWDGDRTRRLTFKQVVAQLDAILLYQG